MYLSLLFLPLIGTILGSFFGKSLGPSGTSFLTCLLMGFTYLYCFLALFLLLSNGYTILIPLGDWFVSGLFHISWNLWFDTLTCVMINVICFISFLVHIYSTEYMGHDPHLPRFMAYLSFFTFFMLILVTGDNFLQLFVGWEGVGLCSYLLINFWFTRIQANKAALKAMILNRVGDVGLALGIFTIFQSFGSVDYATVFSLVPYSEKSVISIFGVEAHLITVISILLFIGAVGKSAQLGLHVWLPDAMEGPTPVSALLHAATMVTAGVFLLTRCSIFLEYAPNAREVVTTIGVLSSLFAGSVGLLQNDLKRVIAYSTASQLGYMVFSCGFSNYGCSFFHLSNHAFFKALLFLSAGSVIHAMGDEQDMRKLGGLRKILPFTYATVSVGSFSLFGIPFLSGFYSKDVILEVAAANYSTAGSFCFILGSVTAFLTAFYSIRLIHLVFLEGANGYRLAYINAHEAPTRMSLPMTILVFPSIWIGFLTKDMFIGFGTNFWGASITTLPKNLLLVDSEFIPQILKQLPLLLVILGVSSAILTYRFCPTLLVALKLSVVGRNLYTFLNRKWFFDKLYMFSVALPLSTFAYHVSYKRIDKGLIETTGPKTASYLSYYASTLSFLSPPLLYYSVLLLLCGLLIFLFVAAFEIYNKVFVFQSLILLTLLTGFSYNKINSGTH